MISVTALVKIKRGGRFHPPGSVFHDFAEHEIEAHGGTVERLNGASAAPPEVVAPLAADAAPPDLEAPAPGPGGALSPDEGVSDVVDVANAILLLEEIDFEGGVPRRAPLAEILGFEPSAELVSAALALNNETA